MFVTAVEDAAGVVEAAVTDWGCSVIVAQGTPLQLLSFTDTIIGSGFGSAINTFGWCGVINANDFVGLVVVKEVWG